MDSDADTTAEDDVFSKVTVAQHPSSIPVANVCHIYSGFVVFAFFAQTPSFFSAHLQKQDSSFVF